MIRRKTVVIVSNVWVEDCFDEGVKLIQCKLREDDLLASRAYSVVLQMWGWRGAASGVVNAGHAL